MLGTCGIILMTVLFGWQSTSAGSEPSDPNAVYCDALDRALAKCVTADGRVDYKGLKKNADFAQAKKIIKTLLPQGTWTREDELAFWINVYNIYTIDLVASKYPLKSIKDIPNAWDSLFVELKDKKYSLNQIEHTILRRKYNEPRIHFAINCAASSCPPIQNKAFRSVGIYKALDALASDFINNPEYNRITADKAELSQIFEWYRDDFCVKKSLVDFINGYSKVKMNTMAEITYIPYNWKLNKK